MPQNDMLFAELENVQTAPTQLVPSQIAASAVQYFARLIISTTSRTIGVMSGMFESTGLYDDYCDDCLQELEEGGYEEDEVPQSLRW